MDLFYSRSSGNSSRAIFALIESGAPWQPCPVDPHAGENRSARYLSINPMGKIPALVDGGLVLWESNAINWYVAEKHPAAGLLPTSIEGRAAVQRWLFFQSGHVSPACIPIFRATNPRVQAFWNVKGDERATLVARQELARFLPVLETALGGRDWLEAQFSLADIAYAPHLALLAEGGFDFTPYPALRAWLDRLLARPAWQKTAQLVFGPDET
jgi:glutathione S-transferase